MEHDRFARSFNAALAGHYAIERELGRGGMAVVYLARDLRHGREVAIKVLQLEHGGPGDSDGFLKEIEITARLQHPHILPLIDSGSVNDLPCYITRYVADGSLKDRLIREGPLEVDNAVRIGREIADALDYAHERGVVHLDIKPGNILLEAGHAVVADFGIAQALAPRTVEEATGTRMRLGTLGYMSPEQFYDENIRDGRSDVYSLGCVMYEMLAGEPPFAGRTAQSLIGQVLRVPAPRVSAIRPAIPSAVDEAIARALMKSPADRFRTAADFSAALAGSLVEQETASFATRPATMITLAALSVATATAAWLSGEDNHAQHVGDGVPPYSVVASVGGTAPQGMRDAVRDLIAVRVDQSGILRAVPPADLERGMQLAGMADTAELDERRARELAFRGSVRTVIVPILHQFGSAFAFSVKLVNAEDGAVVAAASANAAAESDVVVTVGRVVDVMRLKLGELRSDIAADRPLVEVTTPSFIAFTHYSRAQEYIRNDSEIDRCVEAASRAVQADPEFASGWFLLGRCYNMFGALDSGLRAWDRAWMLRARLSTSEQLELEGLRARSSGDDLAALKAFERGSRMGLGFDHYRAEILAGGFGRYEEAVDLQARARARAPFGPTLVQLANDAITLIAAGRFAEAESLNLMMPAEARGTIVTFALASARHQWDELEALAETVGTHPSAPDSRRFMSTRSIAHSRAARGRLDAAAETLHSAFSAGMAGAGFDVSWWALKAVHDDFSTGNPLRIPEPFSIGWQSIRAAQNGDSSAAMGALEEARVSRRIVGGRLHGFQELALTVLDLQRGRYRQAIDALNADRSSFLQLPRWWMLARAYESTGMPDSAASVLERITADRGIMGDYNFVILGMLYPFAEFRLGRHYHQRGDRDRARKHFQAFLETFTDPDADLKWMVHEARQKLIAARGAR